MESISVHLNSIEYFFSNFIYNNLYIQVTPANRSHIQEERQAQDLDQVAAGQDLPPEAQV